MAGTTVCYATPEDLAMLGLPENVLKKVDVQNVQQRHLEVASGKIDTYLRSRYTLPIKQDETTGVYPPELVEACVIIASYSLMQFIGYNPNAADLKFQQRYHDLVGTPNVSGSKGWLDRVASGAVNLALDVDATPNVDEGAPQIDTQPQRGWNIDQIGNPNTRFI